MIFFFFNDTATTEIYTLSLHDALPIYDGEDGQRPDVPDERAGALAPQPGDFETVPALIGRPPRSAPDRKSTRLNSSHLVISYAVFCLKNKKQLSQYALHQNVSTSVSCT